MYRYCMLAIPSIALSSIVAVLGGILPSDMVEIGVHGVRTNPSPSAVCSLTVTTLTRGSIGALQRHEHDRARPHGPHALRVQVVAAHAGGVHPAVAQGPAARAPRQAAPLHKLKKRRLYLLDDLTRLHFLFSTSCQPCEDPGPALSPRGVESPRSSECFRAYTGAPGGVVKAQARAA